MEKSWGLIAKIIAPLLTVAVIGTTGWYIYDSNNPSLSTQLSKEGYVWRPASDENINLDKSYGTVSFAKSLENLFAPKDCSKNFFPGIPDISKGIGKTTNEIKDEDKTFNSIVVPTLDVPETEKGIGCLIFRAGHNEKQKHSEGLVNWEIALKKGKHGVVILGFSSKSSLYTTSNSEEFKWIVVHLKENNNKWNVTSGVIWDELLAVSGSTTKQEIQINIPTKNSYSFEFTEDFCKTTKELRDTYNSKASIPICNGPTSWKQWGVSALWEESSDNQGQEIFEVINWNFPASGKLQPGDTWGQKDFDFSKKEKGGAWSSIYKLWENDRWKDLQEKESNGNYKDKFFDATDYLVKVYSPFARKKGTWTEINKFCKDNGSKRGINDTNLINKVKNLCMTKQI